MGIYALPPLHYTPSFPSIRSKYKESPDLYALLEIVNPDRGHVTCAGYAPSKRRRCQNPIAAHNRQYVESQLRSIENRLAKGLPIYDALVDLASAALCVRYHQGQAHEVASKWESKIKHPRRDDVNVRFAKLQQRMDELEEMMRVHRMYMEQQRKREEEQRQGNREDAWRRYQEDQRRQAEQQKSERGRKARAAQAKAEREEKARTTQEREERARADQERRQQDKKARQKAQTEGERQQQESSRKSKLKSWEDAWTDYQEGFEKLKDGRSKIIPWPVRFGRLEDVTEGAVDAFYRYGPDDTGPSAMYKMLGKEVVRWHPDKIQPLLAGHDLTPSHKAAIAIIGRGLIELRKKFQGEKKY